MGNHKERKRLVANVLTAFLIVLFFIITTKSLAFSAQPQVATGDRHTVGLKTDGTFVLEGTVTFVGVPCEPGSKFQAVSPCSPFLVE